jgi:hypothetical protein
VGRLHPPTAQLRRRPVCRNRRRASRYAGLAGRF